MARSGSENSLGSFGSVNHDPPLARPDEPNDRSERLLSHLLSTQQWIQSEPRPRHPDGHTSEVQGLAQALGQATTNTHRLGSCAVADGTTTTRGTANQARARQSANHLYHMNQLCQE